MLHFKMRKSSMLKLGNYFSTYSSYFVVTWETVLENGELIPKRLYKINDNIYYFPGFPLQMNALIHYM